MINYAICIFLSAFLLFQVETIISKTLLPWFGGTPAVWSSTMFFFQIALTGGYAYANWLVRRRHSGRQATIHLSLIFLSIALLVLLAAIWPSPITPAASWRPQDITNPILKIFLLLLISIGLPFFVLSTNNPLMQAWYSVKNPGHSPYWLYALSNIGSLLGLITYPTIVEPLLTRQQQGWIWTGGFVLFGLLAVYNTLATFRGYNQNLSAEGYPQGADQPKTKVATQALWILLSACPSVLVLAVTSQITQEVAPIPFLWVLPLTIYLLTFVFAFSSRNWYSRRVFTILLLLTTAGWFFVILNPYTHFIVQITVYSLLLFITAMICHGELYGVRPQPSYLTRFYLLISIGGTLGALFVNLIAPNIFPGYWELYISAAFVWILLAALYFKRQGTRAQLRVSVLVSSAATTAIIFMIFLMVLSAKGNLFNRRNFYGVVHVKQLEIGDSALQANTLYHGSTIHGFQFLKPDLRGSTTAYFSPTSGIGLAILSHPRYGEGMRVGILGLGVGTLAAYGQPGDTYRMYEINPVVVDLANGDGGYFSYIKDSHADVIIITGDARICLEDELKDGTENNFDILILDAFSSDSVPAHLVTREAFDIYLQHLGSDGMIAANISNVRLDLRPVFWQLAQFYGLEMTVIQNPKVESDPATFTSTWVLLTRNASLLQTPELQERMASLDDFPKNIRLWTDDYSNLFQILK